MDKDIKDVGILGAILGMSIGGAVFFKDSSILLTGISIGATYLGVKNYVTAQATSTSSDCQNTSTEDSQVGQA